MNNDDNLDLLDLDNNESMDALPAAPAFASPRPKKPWMLLGIGLVVIVLATYIIVRTIGGDSTSSMQVDLDVPTVVVDGGDAAEPLVVPDDAVVVPVQVPVPQPVPKPVPAPQPAPKPKPVAAPQPAVTPGVPVRVVEERKAVTFNPEKVEKAAPKPVVKKATTAKKATAVKKPAAKTAPKPQVAKTASWYVQFGSYSSNAAAAAAQKKIAAEHPSLFAGKQFVILAAVLPNGTTTYRLRVGFATAAEANGFCRNAKSDGLDCYVAK